MIALRIVLIAGLALALRAPALAARSVAPECYQYFKDACSPAIGAWLPRLPGPPAWSALRDIAKTAVHDAIVEPGQPREPVFMRLDGVASGTPFVYGMAGPPRGNLVYDPVDRVAFYDEGCCAWHDVVLSHVVSAPPKRVVMRSLRGVHTIRGIALGVTPQLVRSVFGPAVTAFVRGRRDESTIEYQKAIVTPHYSTCYESYAFLFTRGRLSAMDYGAAC